ncbi:TPA: hypothetical protein DEG21_03300 [Patescibacteria group bacterium]|nr:hypothetical protein [Candidatus Gracilibacteria bacterium]HBY74886.1 hypothetical protein [Candidatus Gracilibacteria bacterium]
MLIQFFLLYSQISLLHSLSVKNESRKQPTQILSSNVAHTFHHSILISLIYTSRSSVLYTFIVTSFEIVVTISESYSQASSFVINSILDLRKSVLTSSAINFLIQDLRVFKLILCLVLSREFSLLKYSLTNCLFLLQKR